MDLSIAAACSEPAKKARRQQEQQNEALLHGCDGKSDQRSAHTGHVTDVCMDVNSTMFAGCSSEQSNALDLSSHSNDEQPSSGSSIHTESQIRMSQIKFVRKLSENGTNKTFAYEGLYHSKPALVVLEKTQMDEHIVKDMIDDTTIPLQVDFVNDVYGSYAFHPNPQFNPIKATITHPASSKHIDKWTSQPIRLIRESFEQYKSITLPFITNHRMDIEWVHNILDGKDEQERIVFRDPDPETGFTLLPDMKWDQKSNTDLYLVAICNKRNIMSLRDLTFDHLPLLQNIISKGCAAIHDKYSLSEDELRIFIHYQPSYYHLHVHFTSLSYTAPGIHTERAHLLQSVIQNIKLLPDYYQTTDLFFPVKLNDPLCKLLSNSH